MDILASRISKIIAGSFLIGLTLTDAEKPMDYEMLYSLVGIPVIFSGIFNWRPAEIVLTWIAKTLNIDTSKLVSNPTSA